MCVCVCVVGGVCGCVCMGVCVCVPVCVSTSLKGHCNDIFDHTSGPLFQMLKYFRNDFVLANIYSHVQFSTFFVVIKTYLTPDLFVRKLLCRG